MDKDAQKYEKHGNFDLNLDFCKEYNFLYTKDLHAVFYVFWDNNWQVLFVADL
jgi:hypothetical protein